jgi:hypothetical protein
MSPEADRERPERDGQRASLGPRHGPLALAAAPVSGQPSSMERVPSSFEAARKRRQALADALSHLEDALASPSMASPWRQEVAEALTEVRWAFDDHVQEVEGPNGLLIDITEDAPRLSITVELLERDHIDIARTIDDLIGALTSANPEAIRAWALGLMRELVLHRQRGSDLVYEAYATDIGGQSGS